MKNSNRLIFLFLTVLFVVASLACRLAGDSQGGSLSAGDHEFSLEQDGRQRWYIVHVPPHAAAGAALPVVINFHGGGGNARGHQQYVQMDAVADQEGFLVVYPEGTGPFRRRLLTWNAGTCCGYAMDQDIADVAFVLAVLDDLASRISIDMTRVYATGLSNGGMMAYRLAAEAGDRVAAIAPVAGAMVLKGFEPVAPVAVMHIHSLDDPRALYHGGLGPPFPLTNSRVTHPDLDLVLEAWAEANGCGEELQGGEDVIYGASDTQNEGQTAELLSYTSCDSSAPVQHWQLSGAGHVWPGGEPGFLEDLLGPSTDIIDANREMWAFFSQFTRVQAGR